MVKEMLHPKSTYMYTIHFSLHFVFEIWFQQYLMKGLIWQFDYETNFKTYIISADVGI